MRNKVINILICILGVGIIIGGYFLKESFAIPENGKKIKIINKTESDTSTQSEDDARFVLLDENQNVVKLFEAGVNKGTTELSEIQAGTYTIKNYYAPKGYGFLDDKSITVDETDDEQTFELISKKDNNPKVTIGMYNATNNELIENSIFEVKNESGEVITTCTTDKIAPCIIKNIEKGNYTINETTMPKGFITNTETSFDITEDGVTKVVAVKRIPTKLKICKVDSNTSSQLSGANFELYDSNNTLVDSWTTTEEVHYLEGLEFGTYTLKEVKAPDGYSIKTETQTIEIRDADETVNVVFADNPTIPVENTAISKDKIYIIIGVVLILIGLIGLFISKKRND